MNFLYKRLKNQSQKNNNTICFKKVSFATNLLLLLFLHTLYSFVIYVVRSKH